MKENEAYIQVPKIDTSQNDAYGAFSVTVDLKGISYKPIISVPFIWRFHCIITIDLCLLLLLLFSSLNGIPQLIKLENEAYIQVSKIDASKNDAYGAFTTDLKENEPYYSSARQL